MWQETRTQLRRFGGRMASTFLILGEVTPEQRDEALQELLFASGRDAYRPQLAMPFELPGDDTGIVVIDEAAHLSAREQDALLHWLDRHRDTMVLSFSDESVYPLVAHGMFSERLFYRLNLITLKVDDEGA